MPNNLIFLAIEFSLTKCLSFPLTYLHSCLCCCSVCQFSPCHVSFLSLAGALTTNWGWSAYRLNARKSIRGKNEEGVSISLSELRSGTASFANPTFSQTSPGGIHKVRDVAVLMPIRCQSNLLAETVRDARHFSSWGNNILPAIYRRGHSDLPLAQLATREAKSSFLWPMPIQSPESWRKQYIFRHLLLRCVSVPFLVAYHGHLLGSRI
jgi:hypothetical protein